MQPFFTRNDGNPLHTCAGSEPTSTTKGCSPRPGVCACAALRRVALDRCGIMIVYHDILAVCSFVEVPA